LADKEIALEAPSMEPGWKWRPATIGAVLLSSFHLYTAFFGVFDSIIQRSIHLGLVMFIGFLSYPLTRRPLGNALLSILGFASPIYLLFIYESLIDRMGVATPLDLWIGGLALILVLVLGFQTLGWPLPLLTGLFLAYAYYGHGLPSFLAHKGMPLERLISWQFITTEGLWGIPLGVMATFVFLFVLYGALLSATGAGELIMDVAIGLTGRARGGPAKVAVVSSSLFGTISGSVVANVVGTGTFTIPLMKRVGYPAYYAAGVEAVASTGGLIMPPIMGAAAFVMADIMGVGYAAVAKAALIPALLYYAALFVQLHLRAISTGIRGLATEELPDWRRTLRRSWHLSISPLVLIYLLMWENASAMKSAFWAIVTLLIVSAFRRETRLTLSGIIKAFMDAGRLTVPVTMGCALAGIIMGVVTVTGLGLKFATGVVELAGGSLPLLLVLVMVASLILGMGVTATVAYLLPAIIVAPILVKMGVPKMAAHFFCFYFAAISYITPPVAIGAYAAAGVAQANPMKTGFAATKLGIVGFIIPFLFISHSTLLLDGRWPQIIASFATGLIGVVVVAAAMEGWLMGKCNFLQRALLIAGGLLMMKPGFITDIAGLVALAIVFVWQRLREPQSRSEES
jgi:TRAP transporter 4TM/12TM fusion protein